MFELINALLVIAVAYLLFEHRSLKAQLSEIQKKLNDLTVPPPAESDGDAAPSSQAAATADPAVVTKTGGPWKRAAKGADGPAKPEADTGEAKPRPTFFVFKTENWALARAWLMANWFLAIAALSLALAGVFLVQYGVENGLLSPFWRVMAAVALGVALIAGGEFVRRKWGDEGGDHTAYLPSTFAGAGLVALFAAVLAARQLYGLIGAETALVWLVLVSVVAVVLGWFYGPFLAVVGILGSVAAPFLVGGQSDTPEVFYYYFAIVAVAALLVDAIKRWAWVSALGLMFTFAGAWMIWASGAPGGHFLAFAVIAATAAIAVPRLSVSPSHDGAMVSVGLAGVLRRKIKGAEIGLVEFPTRVAAGAFAGAGAIAMLVALDDAGTAEVWLAIATMGLLYLMATLWCRNADALGDLAVVPPLLLLGVIVLQAMDYGSLFSDFRLGLQREPESAPPVTVSALAIMGLAGSVIAHWRAMFEEGRLAQVWAAGAALLAPLVLVTLEFWWAPEPVLGAGRWAAHGIVIAALMVLFAGQAGRRDGDDKRRVAYYALAALTMITFALVIVLSTTALTLALAVMVLGATVIDRRLNLPLLSIFVQVGVIVVGWRLVIEPGVFWASDAPLWEVLLAYLGSVALIGAAWVLLAARARERTRVTVESGIWAMLGVLASVLLERALGPDTDSHWALSLFASVWLMLMLVQIYRIRAGGIMRWVRIVLAAVYGLLATALFAVLAVFANPLLSSGEWVIGPPVFDSLLVAFGVPALILAVGVWKIPKMHRFFRLGFIIVSALFAAIYVALEIRRLWRGTDLSVPGTTGSELYSYTIAMLLVSVALLFLAFARRSLPLRQIAIAGIALTIAKVFLVDMAELVGLLRVASFLGLGLSLAGLGWVYRRMSDQWERVEPEE